MKQKKPKQNQLSEHEIQTQITELLTKVGIFHFRNNTGRKHNILFGIIIIALSYHLIALVRLL